MTQQKFIDLHWLAPQIEVIDRAIELICSGQREFCCYALGAAVSEASGGHEPESFVVAELYRRQFERFCASQNGGYLPRWWSGKPTMGNQRRRISALRAFRAACIAAAKDQS